MIIKPVIVGWLRTNCYIVGDEATKTCAIIDPGQKADQILEAVAELGLEVKLILLTHGHYDHVMAVPQIVKATGAKVYIHKKDQWLLECDEVLRYGTRAEGYSVPHIDGFLEDGQTIALGSLTFKVLHTPGHTAGCCVFLCEEAMFSGDTLFQECCGRTDLETGSLEDILRSLKRLAQLEGNFRVFPGHEGFSSLEYERQYNPYIREAMRR
jgi:glyoxylase-like metal-dependent hydrolase (beta-lactamase superfamily II)